MSRASSRTSMHDEHNPPANPSEPDPFADISPEAAALLPHMRILLEACMPSIVSRVQQLMHSPLNSAAQAAHHAQAVAQQASVAAQQAVHQAAEVAQHTAQQVAHQAAYTAAQHASAQVAQHAYTAPMQSVIMKDVLKHLRPPAFSGEPKKDSMKYEEFCYKANAYFDVLSLPDASRMMAVPHMLTGDANLYWRTHIEPKNLTYREALDILGKKFSDHLMAEKCRAKLRKLAYKGSVSALISQIDRLCLHIPDISDSEKKERLQSALPSQVRVALAVQIAQPETLTYEALCEKAERIDHAIASANTNQSGSNSGQSAKTTTPMEVNAISPSRYVPKKPKGSQPKGNKPQAKQQATDTKPKLQKLTDAEREELRAKGGCFRCRETGHMSHECPLKSKNAK
jgi:hypothetical protein